MKGDASMNAIVYTSNSGFTAQYAKLLGAKINLPVFTLEEAAKNLQSGSEIIYMGWLMASNVHGYKKAAGRYRIKAVCGVGMGQSGTQNDDVRKANAIAQTMPVFTLQGGFDLTKLHGIYKFMMSAMKRSMGKKLAEKPDKTAEELDMLDLLQNGGNRVSEEHLSPVIAWYQKL